MLTRTVRERLWNTGAFPVFYNLISVCALHTFGLRSTVSPDAPKIEERDEGNGVKVIIEYRTNPEGKKVKVRNRVEAHLVVISARSGLLLRSRDVILPTSRPVETEKAKELFGLVGLE